MKKEFIAQVFLLFFVFGCNSNNADNLNMELKQLNCSNGAMDRAYPTMGKDEFLAAFESLDPEFLIVIDTNFNTKNFISYFEESRREESIELDTSSFYSWVDGWDKMNKSQKLKFMKQEMALNKREADSLHFENNHGKQQVWLINNSNDTVAIQMQDWLYICVLQAKTRSGAWLSIEYWKFSSCGNSYYIKQFPPKTANSFVMTVPNRGNLQTKLRYKLLGADKFYYSNEFEGKINECEFLEDSTKNFDRRYLELYKLDSFIKTTY